MSSGPLNQKQESRGKTEAEFRTGERVSTFGGIRHKFYRAAPLKFDLSNKLQLSHLALFTVALIYGANYSLAKIIMDPGLIQPNAFILLRVLAASLLFGIFTRSREPIRKEDYLDFAICAICGVAGNQLLFFNGLKWTSPLHAALIMVCSPILVLILQTLLGKPLTRLQVLGCFIGLFGAVYLIYTGSLSGTRNASMEGDLMVLGNALLYAYYLIRVPRLISRYGAFPVMKWIFIGALLPVSALGAGELADINLSAFGLPEWGALVFVLLATTFVAYALNAYALAHSSPALVGNYIYLQPLLASWIAIALKKDHWTMDHFLSACLIFGGLYLSSTKKEEF
ncbi:MAG TPA: DMT family transporter [Saprospiraceae bacterium]|nr:DMT family transporter [Saprospiraceae bacterium]